MATSADALDVLQAFLEKEPPREQFPGAVGHQVQVLRVLGYERRDIVVYRLCDPA